MVFIWELQSCMSVDLNVCSTPSSILWKIESFLYDNCIHPISIGVYSMQPCHATFLTGRATYDLRKFTILDIFHPSYYLCIQVLIHLCNQSGAEV